MSLPTKQERRQAQALQKRWEDTKRRITRWSYNVWLTNFGAVYDDGENISTEDVVVCSSSDEDSPGGTDLGDDYVKNEEFKYVSDDELSATEVDSGVSVSENTYMEDLEAELCTVEMHAAYPHRRSIAYAYALKFDPTGKEKEFAALGPPVMVRVSAAASVITRGRPPSSVPRGALPAIPRPATPQLVANAMPALPELTPLTEPLLGTFPFHVVSANPKSASRSLPRPPGPVPNNDRISLSKIFESGAEPDIKDVIGSPKRPRSPSDNGEAINQRKKVAKK